RFLLGSSQGEVLEPEKGIMLAEPDAKKSFDITASQAERFFDYVYSHWDAKYSFRHFNCTHFAVGALAAAGYPASEYLGRVTTKKLVAPNKVYKRLYERAALGEKDISLNKKLNKDERHVRGHEEAALRQLKPDALDLTAGADNLARSAA